MVRRSRLCWYEGGDEDYCSTPYSSFLRPTADAVAWPCDVRASSSILCSRPQPELPPGTHPLSRRGELSFEGGPAGPCELEAGLQSAYIHVSRYFRRWLQDQPGGAALAEALAQEALVRIARTCDLAAECPTRGALQPRAGRGFTGWVKATNRAEPYLREHVRKDRELSLRRSAGSSRSARGESILRAVEQLEQALPRDAELMIRGHPAYADDLLAGLRRLVREMD
jgi:hypothetical protein